MNMYSILEKPFRITRLKICIGDKKKLYTSQIHPIHYTSLQVGTYIVCICLVYIHIAMECKQKFITAN